MEFAKNGDTRPDVSAKYLPTPEEIAALAQEIKYRNLAKRRAMEFKGDHPSMAKRMEQSYIGFGFDDLGDRRQKKSTVLGKET